MILLAYLPAYTDRIGFWTLDGDTTRWIGVALLVGGSALRLWPVFVLGNRFSGLVAIQHGHTLVTTGVYGVIRNPSYLGLLVSSLGWALAFRSASWGGSRGVLHPTTGCAHSRGRTIAAERTSAASTMPTAPARHGLSPDSTEKRSVPPVLNRAAENPAGTVLGWSMDTCRAGERELRTHKESTMKLPSMTRRDFVRLGAGAVVAGTAVKSTLLEPMALAPRPAAGFDLRLWEQGFAAATCCGPRGRCRRGFVWARRTFT